ncbi:MAG: hypothetical protein M3144_07095 [Actinomycetota bacterium]|nr:hypothetical protein [Actinomycetota bacterium]
MTGDDRTVPALQALVEDICSADDVAALTALWGRAEPSDARPDGIRVVCPADCPFQALEIRPWSEDVTGVVDVELRVDGPRPGWAAVRERFGPFRELPRLHPSAPQYGALAAAPDRQADAYLIVTVDNDTIAAVTVRRDPR